MKSKIRKALKVCAWAFLALLVLSLFVDPPEEPVRGAPEVPPPVVEKVDQAESARALLNATGNGDWFGPMQAYYGTLEIQATRQLGSMWAVVDCDAQRDMMTSLLVTWRLVDESGHTVRLQSYTGRELGLAKRRALGGVAYHCD